MTLLREPIDELLATIERQRIVVEDRLPGPARWRGPLRKPGDPARVRRVARAFDRLAARSRRGELARLSPDALLLLHRDAVGGGEYRTRGARVGEHVFRHAAASIPAAVATSMERVGDGVEPPPLAAARLHLELALIHPFSNGNGRIARLAASWVLLRSGYRSTLLTAVEQHPRYDRAGYAHGFALLNPGGLDTQGPWLRMALGQMASASAHAAAYRDRELTMRATLDDSGVAPGQQDALLIAHDFDGAAVPALSDFDRWSETSPGLSPAARSQIKRLLAEEAGARGR